MICLCWSLLPLVVAVISIFQKHSDVLCVFGLMYLDWHIFQQMKVNKTV